MAELEEDGCLNVNTDVKEIVYHPALNVILIITVDGVVKVLDVNSGVILQSTAISAQSPSTIKCKYIPAIDRVLFCDGQSLGIRSDYNGVLLLDSILQTNISKGTDQIKLELPLSEAIIFRQSLTYINNGGFEHVVTELTEAITKAQKQVRKGIKAQKWNTVCLNVRLADLRLAAFNTVSNMLAKNQHIPELGVASAIQERLSELLGEKVNAADRKSMASEIRRRETFSQWPHMDYKWALPDQMAQAGFYHLPNTLGDDRAMCFTCTVCLVSWECTDEPWSEHERHSPRCPFVMGEYTQNVPSSVTMATSPAADAKYRGSSVKLVGNSSLPNLVPVANWDCLISVFDITDKINRTHSFYVSQFDSAILEQFTQDFVQLRNSLTAENKKYPIEKITSLCIMSQGTNSRVELVRPTILCGLNLICESPKASGSKITEKFDKSLVTYLVVYDFTYKKEENDTNDKKNQIDDNFDAKNVDNNFDSKKIDTFEDDMNPEGYNLMKQLSSYYKSLLPNECDEILLEEVFPKKKFHTGPKILMDSGAVEISISDHISEVKNNNQVNNKKLNYSRAVQCLNIPGQCINVPNLEVSDMIPMEWCVLVVLKSPLNNSKSFLVLYALDCTDKMVKIHENPLKVRELSVEETPVEISYLPKNDENLENLSCTMGAILMVCVDGALRILDPVGLQTVYHGKKDGQHFVSAVYCNGLDKLCCSTKYGSLHFFPFNNADDEKDKKNEEDEENFQRENFNSTETSDFFHKPIDFIPIDNLKEMKNLCEFELLKKGYSVAVPPCWNEFLQKKSTKFIQKQQQHHSIKVWRLQTNTTTYDEHIFEITLSNSISLGKIDLFFTLQSKGIIPLVEVTLLEQNTSSSKREKKVEPKLSEYFKKVINMYEDTDDLLAGECDSRFPLDENGSQEFLRGYNTEVLAGPIDFSSSLDLTEKNGVITLTSPKLFKKKSRNLLLHIKAIKDDETFLRNKNKKQSDKIDELDRSDKSDKFDKISPYIGCDVIHEISIVLYTQKNTDIGYEKIQRNLMLNSNFFLKSLLGMVTSYNHRELILNDIFDILNWIASIKLTKNGCETDLQIEFLKLVEEKLNDLLRCCVLLGGRSLARKCAKLIVTCCSGADNVSHAYLERFNSSVLKSLFIILENITDVNSAGGLQWIFALLLKISTKKNEHLIAGKCVKLLESICEKITEKNNPFYLILRSRYGLYGTPMEPQLFDVDQPNFLSSKNDDKSYKENIIDPKEIFSSSSKTKFKSNSAFSRNLYGLIESEPLHFVCVESSEGTRVEKLDENEKPGESSTSLSSFFQPFLYKTQLKKEEEEMMLQNYLEVSLENLEESGFEYVPPDTLQALHQTGGSLPVPIDLCCQKKGADSLPDSDVPFPPTPPPPPPPLSPLSLRRLLIPPPRKSIVIERMNSGARRFVILDFGKPILLTDVFFPSCSDLVLLTLDYWLKSEDVDGKTLVQVTDVGAKGLAMTDLQPETLCRYLKITVVGRYGMSPVRSRIPLGYFYGHSVILPDDIPYDVRRDENNLNLLNFSSCMKQLEILTKLFEDISCRYNLACSKLKELLRPLLLADMRNSVHLRSYMKMCRDRNNDADLEYNKVFGAYQETIRYQHQLNIIKNVISRIERNYRASSSHLYNESCPGNSSSNSAEGTSSTRYRNDCNESPFPTRNPIISTDKLTTIAGSILEVLLSIEASMELSRETCEKYFYGLCVSQSSRLQILAATFLDKSCGRTSFWGDFLADTLAEYFSTNFNTKCPQDRLFILLSYLSEKQVDKSGIIDATLRTTYETLTPLNSYTTKNGKNSLLAVLVDLNLLSWQLMYLSLNLKNMKSVERWDWVSGETIGDKIWDKVNESKKNGNGMKKKNGKRVASATLHHNLNITPGGFQVMFTTTTNPNQLATKAKLIRKKLKEELKEREPVPEKQPEPKSLIVKPQIVDNVHCLAVAKNLLRLILFMDHSSSSDMVLLSFKVISRLVTLAKLRLSDLLESDLELLHLVRFCIHCKIPWVPFALACFLQDSLEVTEDGYEAAASETESFSSSWDCPGEPETNENYHYEFTSSPINSNATPKPMTNISQLPSVYESEDNSDLEDLVEDFHKIRNFNSNSNNSFSCAIDSRLEKGVEMKSEIELRKMIIKNSNILAQNLTTVNCTKGEKNIQLNPWNVATSISTSQQTNKQMLIRCFESLFLEIEEANSEKLEQILNLWLLLNCPLNSKEPFQPSILPQIPLQCVSVQNLITTIARSPSVSITTWCLTLQILTLILNTCDSCDTIVGHQDFVRLFMNLLSGTGPDLAGPSLCRALHDILVRLQMRCDVVSSTSRLGNRLKNLLLEIIYGLTRPSGPIASYIGPLDAQCGFLRGLLYLDFSNTDLSISMSTFENTASLVHSHLVNDTRNVKCRNVSSDKNKMAPNMNTFSDIFASVVLGSDSNKQDRNVSYEDLLISMLKLMGRLVQMHTLEQTKMDAFQTDESKAEQILKQESPTTSSVKSFADFVLSNRHAFITLCRCLAACKSSSLCMLANISQKAIIPGYLGEPTTVADAVFHLLASVARMASARELLVEPLLAYLNGPQVTGLPGRPLSEPFVWFIMMQVLENEEAIRTFHKAGGIVMLAKNIVSCIDSPSTLRRIGTISSVMQHFTTAKKTGVSEDDSSSLINFAPFCTITCESGTAQPPDVLIQSMIGAAHSHRRARTPVWSYHFYPEEVHTELILHLPTAILLKEVQLQPHIGGLATCPSFVAIEVSSNGPNRLMPLGPPLPTSGLTFIKVDLPRPKVVNCILIRLYRPKDANSIGLLHIRVLGNQAFGVSQSQSSENEDESHCRHSLGWLRLLHHCFTLVTDEETKKEIVDCASKVENLLATCCNLLLVPSHILPVYLPCLEKVLRELALHCPENGLNVIKALLENSGNIEPFTIFDTSWQRRRSVDDDLAAAGHRSICELLCRICDHLDPYTSYRVETILKWLGNMAKEAILNENTKHCNVAYISSVASILWSAKKNSQKHVLTYDLNSLIKMELFDQILELKIRSESNLSLKNALDSILCSICYIRPEFYTILLHRMGVIKDIVEFKQSLFLRKNRILVGDDSTNERLDTIDSSENSVSKNEEALPSASAPGETSTGVCDKNVTSELLETIPFNSDTFENVFLVQNLTRENLETIASVSRSIPTIELLINSQLPKLLNSLILKFCAKNDANDNIANVSFISSILNFFTDVCEERAVRDYLGSEEGSLFWPDLLKFLCDKDDVDAKKNNYGLQSEERVDLEEVCVRFLRKCCLCHQVNQARLGKVLCDVIRYQSSSSSAISGFMRRLILQLLLETEKIPVSIESAEETLYKKKSCPVFYVPTHPAFKQTYNRTILYLSTNTTLLEILQQHISFNSNNYKAEESTTQTNHALPRALFNPNNYKSEELEEEKLTSPYLKTVFFNPPEEKSSTFLKKSFLKKDDIFKNCFFVCDVDDESEASFAASAAGAAAKDKRAKEAKNQQMTAASHLYSKTVKKKKIMVVSKQMDPPTTSTSATDSKKSSTSTLPVENDDTKVVADGRAIMCETVSDSALPLGLSLGQVLRLIEKKDFKTVDGGEVDWPYVHLKVYKPKDSDKKETSPISLQDQQPICSALQVFSSFGGLALLAQHLPTIYPDAIKTTETEEKTDRRRCEVDMYKVIEDVDDIYEDVTEDMSTTSTSPPLQHVPPHSLASFGLFLRLPGYADVLLTDVKKALCLLRLVLGVVDDGEGSDIFHSPIADSLPILPFEVLRQLYDSTPLNTDLRQLSVNLGVIHLILTCLSIFTHQSENRGEKDTFGNNIPNKSKEERSQLYWAKGTGFGTGSTEQNWNVEQALMKQKNEEEHVTVLLAVLSSYINPDGNSDEPISGEILPSTFHDLLAKSALLPVISSYLRNDSVLDMARHIPLYKAVLKLLRAIAGNSQLVDLLLPVKNKNSSEPSLSSLLKNMRQCVDAYASKLGISHLMKQQPTADDPEGLATLMPDILRTAEIVSKVTASFIDAENNSDKECAMIEKKAIVSIEEQYMRIMKSLQFSSYDMIAELPDGSIRFTISHHFESSVKNSNTNSVHPTRVKRIAQEAATLSTSLPLSYNSSVFGRYDTARLDVMKILITGPADTPYANGCFEFDAYFPTNYPASPMMINLETTGRHTVRFNPNLYNDGKVCLSVLNTWHGRPEEKWNPHTSSFLQVLVSIQSLILVPEPYFNEPGYERARGTPAGAASSREYDANVRQATVRWAMLEQLVNPSECFREVIETHFYLKRDEILSQVEKWIEETERDKKATQRQNKKSSLNNLDNFKKIYAQLKEMLLKLKPPAGSEEQQVEDVEEEGGEAEEVEELSTTPTNDTEATAINEVLQEEEAIEKMVVDTCDE